MVKLDGIVERGGEADRGELYGFHESIVNALRPALNEGVKSIVIAAPGRTDQAVNFLNHIRRHHAWLVREGPNAASFGILTGSAGRPHEVRELVRTKEFREVIGETTSRDAKNIAATLEKSLGSDDSGTVVSYSLDEIENLICGQKKQSGFRPEHLVLTDKYLEGAERRGRILRLLQISKNIGIKTTIINAKTQAGLRLSQLGGLVCFAKIDRENESAKQSQDD